MIFSLSDNVYGKSIDIDGLIKVAENINTLPTFCYHWLFSVVICCVLLWSDLIAITHHFRIIHGFTKHISNNFWKTQTMREPLQSTLFNTRGIYMHVYESKTEIPGTSFNNILVQLFAELYSK